MIQISYDCTALVETINLVENNNFVSVQISKNILYLLKNKLVYLSSLKSLEIGQISPGRNRTPSYELVQFHFCQHIRFSSDSAKQEGRKAVKQAGQHRSSSVSPTTS